MNNPINIDEQLDAWLAGELEEDSLDRMLAEAGIEDPALEKSGFQTAAYSIIRWAAANEVASIHEEFLQSVTNEKPQAKIRTLSLKWPWRVAAILLLGLLGWLSVTYIRTSSQNLYAELFQPYEINTERGWDDLQVHEMLQEFKQKNYKAVVRIHGGLRQTNNREEFLAGYAWLELGEPGTAELSFRKIMKNNAAGGTSLYQDEAEYYLALALLSQKKNAEARSLFKRMAADNEHTFHAKAKKWTLTRLGWLR